MDETPQERKARFDKIFSDCSPVLLKLFKDWNNENPQVYDLFLKYSLEAKKSGRKRFSGWMIANRIRWYTTIETTGNDFKLSNDFIALFTRLVIFKNPEFEGFFQLKKLNPYRKV
jgi:hypothetical protein